VVLLATGTRPLHPPQYAIDNVRVYDSDSILMLDRVPRSLAILGGGVAGCEYASLFAALGVHVSLIDSKERLLPWLDAELSHAMQDLPHAFPALFVASVRATEKTGDLPDALRRYLGYQAQLELVRKKIVSASIYPVLLMGVGLLVLLFLLGYVVPKFSQVYEDIQGDLPLMSQLLLELGKFLGAHGLAAAVVGLGAAALAARFAFSRAARGWLGEKLWRIPAIGSRMRLYQLARFYRTLGMLLRGGTPVVTALDMASGLLAPTLQPSLARAREEIREGRAISEAMSGHGLTTPVSLRMLRVGERSGRMDEMMDRIAGFLDDEIARWVDWFTRLFEPLLMVFIGLIIGVIVVLMYLPVFELAGSIQ